MSIQKFSKPSALWNSKCICRHAQTHYFLNTACDKIAPRDIRGVPRHVTSTRRSCDTRGARKPTHSEAESGPPHAQALRGRVPSAAHGRTDGRTGRTVSRRGFPAGRGEQHEGRQARAGGSRAPTAPPRGRAPSAPLSAGGRNAGAAHRGLGAAYKPRFSNYALCSSALAFSPSKAGGWRQGMFGRNKRLLFARLQITPFLPKCVWEAGTSSWTDKLERQANVFTCRSQCMHINTHA